MLPIFAEPSKPGHPHLDPQVVWKAACTHSDYHSPQFTIHKSLNTDISKDEGCPSYTDYSELASSIWANLRSSP